MYEIKYHKLIKKDIKHFGKDLQKEIKYNHIQEISKSPLSYPHLKGTLKEFRKYTFRYKGVGYRIIYKVIEKKINIYIIMKRENVYQHILRRFNF